MKPYSDSDYELIDNGRDDNEGIDIAKALSWLTSPDNTDSQTANLQDPLPNPDGQSITTGIPDISSQNQQLPSTRRPGRILSRTRFLDKLRRPWSRLQ